MSGSRDLSGVEGAALAALLAVDFPGVEALREQASTVRARPGCTCGCGTLDLLVPHPAVPAAVVDRVPVEATITGSDGGPAGMLLLFVDDGLLSSLEVAGLDVEPLAMPAAERITGVTVANPDPGPTQAP